MATKKGKREHYDYLFDRLALAIQGEFYLEAAWIAHAIIEDRLKSAIQHAGVKKASRLADRIAILQKAKKQGNLPARGAFFDDLLEKIDDWRVQRNRLTHNLGNEIKPAEELIKQFKGFAEQGEQLAKKTSSSVMRLKKRAKKHKDN